VAARPLSRLAKVALLAAPTLLVLGLAEAAVRLAGFGLPPAERGPNVNAYFIISDPVIGFRNRPRGEYVWRQLVGHPRATTDERGFRNGLGWSARGAEPVIVFVGDSTTFCAEVPDDRTGPSEVARALRARGRSFRVLNAGVRGYSSVQAKRMLRECLQQFPSVALVVYTYCHNDYVENVNPIVYYPFQAPAAWLDPATGRIEEVEAAEPAVGWGRSFHVAAEGERRAFLERVAVASHSSLLYHTQRRARRLLARNAYAGRRRLPRGSLGPVLSGGEEWEAQIEWAARSGADPVLEEQLRQMAAMARARGAVFLATRYTWGGEDEQDRSFAAICERAGVPFAGLSALFQGDPREFTARLLDGTYDDHYGPEGTRTYARALLPAIERALDGQEDRRESPRTGNPG
jgi:hypothetical protein